MKHRIYGQRICILLCSMILLSLCSCNTKNSENKGNVAIEAMESEPVDAYSFDFLGGRDVMPILGFYGPSQSTASVDGIAMPDYVTDDIFSSIADCGVNLMCYSISDFNEVPNYVFKMLELGEKYGVGITVTDSGISEYDKNLTLEKIDERVKKYSRYPAFCGVYGVDEPSSATYEGAADNISVYANKINLLEQLGIWTYGNLMPCRSENLREKYNDYVEEWLTTCNVKMLLWDYYVHDEGMKKSDYFYSLSYGREKAAKYDIPFWVFVQAGGQFSDAQEHFDSAELYPTEGELLWNVNTSLAYGAKGIAYFPLIQPYFYAYAESQPFDFERNGLIGASGNKNRWWYYAQKANSQIAAVDEVLMNSVSKGVIITSAQAKIDNADSTCIIEGNSWRELADVNGDVMIGCFNYDGKSVYYVVNYDMQYAQKITMKFLDDYNFTMTQNAKTSKYQGSGIELVMKPGEGVLVIME